MRMKTIQWSDYKKKMLRKPGFQKALRESSLEYEIACSLIEARHKKKISQATLAKKLNTRQSVISRVENMGTTPSLSFLRRLAKALDMELKIQFV